MKRILFTLSLFLCLNAQANSISDWFAMHGLTAEGSIGWTQFGKTNNSVWYQNGYEHQLDLQSQSWSIGVSKYVLPRTRGRIEYTYLGNVTTQAMAVQDPDYNGVDGCRYQHCHANFFHTEGSVRGVSFTLAPEMVVGDKKVFIEAGAFVFLPKFIATVSPTRGASPVIWKEYSESWQVGAQLGVGVQHKNIQFVLTAYNTDSKTPDVDAVPNQQGVAYNAKLRWML